MKKNAANIKLCTNKKLHKYGENLQKYFKYGGFL